MAKSRDLRDLVIGHHNRGLSVFSIVPLLLNKVSERTAFRWIKDYKSSQKVDRIKPAGRPATATSAAKIKKALTLFNKKMSAKKIAKEINISRTSIRRIKKKLGLVAYINRYVPLLTEDQMIKRVKPVQK